ncbi:hypothetical protein WJX73_005126 [Symbiochloris irregularis]|uniref:Uncharacterized protein n=1 Tax=Symbiochloris irregularis TaxID=706552 RepID=A0AAW1NY84_9CHLO
MPVNQSDWQDSGGQTCPAALAPALQGVLACEVLPLLSLRGLASLACTCGFLILLEPTCRRSCSNAPRSVKIFSAAVHDQSSTLQHLAGVK